MRRREFIMLSGAATVWPLVARAQQPTMPVVGFLDSKSPDDSAHMVAAFRRGLDESTFIEGQYVTIEFRWAQSQYDIFRRAAAYVDRILRGEKPSELPVQQPTKFEFVVNLKTANALGLEMPPDLLALADEVIE